MTTEQKTTIDVGLQRGAWEQLNKQVEINVVTHVFAFILLAFRILKLQSCQV